MFNDAYTINLINSISDNMNLTVTIPNRWNPNDKMAFIKWMGKIKNIHYTKIQ